MTIIYETKDDTRIFQIEKIIDGAITPVRGKDKGENVVIRNSEYWIAPDIIDRARRQVARPRLRPQLEFRGPLGRNRAARLGQRCAR